MKKKQIIGTLCAGLLSVGFAFPAQAVSISGQGTWETTLQARDLDGDTTTIEAYYDTILDITWLVQTSVESVADPYADGLFTWEDANIWAGDLDVSGVTGWRLPDITPVNGVEYDITPTADGSTDRLYADSQGWVDSMGNPTSEIGHLFYVTLGNLSPCDPEQPYCAGRPGSVPNIGPFVSDLLYNSDLNYFWARNEYDSTHAWNFGFDTGSQDLDTRVDPLAGWAVHDGDVGVASAVPLPSAAWLFGSGLIGLFSASRFRKQTSTRSKS